MSPPPGFEILDAVLRDVWTLPLRRYTDLQFIAPQGSEEPRVVLWRAHWDTYHWVIEPFSVGREARDTVTAIDTAISRALARMPRVSVSEALVAGERRRCVRKGRSL